MKFYVLIYLDGKSLAVKYEVKYIETAPGDIFNRKILIFIKKDFLTIYHLPKRNEWV